MKHSYSRLGVPLWLAVGVIACVGCDRMRQEPSPTGEQAAASAQPTPQTANMTPVERADEPTLDLATFANCEPSAKLQGWLSRVDAMTDSNGDGKIDKQEADAAADFLVGGFVFRADKNGDNTISPEEGRAVRKELKQRRPVLTAFLTRTAQEHHAAIEHLEDLLSIDYSKPVTSQEMRKAGHEAVDELFQMVDTDKDGNLTMAELQTAGWTRAHAMAKDLFEANDTNHDDKLSLQELRAALDQPIQVAFKAADANNDGFLSEKEAGEATRVLMQRLGLPIAATERAGASQALGKH